MSTVMDNTAKGRSVGTNFWVFLLVLSLLVVGGNTVYSIVKAQRLSGASGAASNLQVNSQRLANQGREAVGGDADAFVEFIATRQQNNSDVESLNVNFGQAPGVSGQIATVTETWLPLNKSAQQVIDSERAVLGLAGNANSFVQRVPQLQAQMDEVVRAMLASGSASSQVYLAVREGILAATMARRVAEIQAGGPGAQIAGDALARDAGVFSQVLEGFREGGTGEAQKVTAPAAVASLNNASALWNEMSGDLDAILGSSQDLFRAQAAAESIAAGSDKMLADSENLFSALTAFGSLKDTSIIGGVWVSIIAGALTLFALVGLYFSTRRAERKRYESTMELNNRNQEAIMRLLDEMGSLAEGDLTVK